MTRIQDAANYARHQYNRCRPLDDEGKPFYRHPQRTAQILRMVTGDEDVIIAGYLHDLIEDTDITEDNLRDRFGDRITDLVVEVTETAADEFDNLKTRDAYLIKFADRLDNLSRMGAWTEGRKARYLLKSKFW